ncbi:MAG: hypothetical protein DRP74_02150 [Candidatus Omnitrophota bacterium]|mgnify:CR=1 FL=1|nr:MAG: hypothetical protein DRP74_02150 [Candidatus Omnitrophota bacterium]
MSKKSMTKKIEERFRERQREYIERREQQHLQYSKVAPLLEKEEAKMQEELKKKVETRKKRGKK